MLGLIENPLPLLKSCVCTSFEEDRRLRPGLRPNILWAMKRTEGEGQSSDLNAFQRLFRSHHKFGTGIGGRERKHSEGISFSMALRQEICRRRIHREEK